MPTGTRRMLVDRLNLAAQQEGLVTCHTYQAVDDPTMSRVVTPGRDGKVTAQTTVPTRPNSMHVMKSAAAEESDRKEPEAAPIFIRPSRRHFFPDVQIESFGRLQDEMVLKRSTHAPASPPKRAWHANGQSISIEGLKYGPTNCVSQPI